MSDSKQPFKLVPTGLREAAHDVADGWKDVNWRRVAKYSVRGLAALGIGYWGYKEAYVSSPAMSWYYTNIPNSVIGSRITTNTAQADSSVDHRLGYDVIPQARESAKKHHDHVTDQKPWRQYRFFWNYHYPIFDRPTNPGLSVTDANGVSLYDAHNFRPAPYKSIHEIAPIIKTLATYIEDKNLLDFTNREPTYNRGVDIPRTFKAGLQQLHLYPGRSGGSGMNVQKIKQLSSKDGRTHGILNKIAQNDASSIDMYRDGKDTTARAQKTILDYLNMTSMGGHPLTGELIGLREGMAVHFSDTTYDEVLTKLDWSKPETATAFRRVLTLMKAWERPSADLITRQSKGEIEPRRWADTQRRIDEVYLPKMVKDGILTQEEADKVKQVKLDGTQLGKDPALPKRPPSEKFVLSMNNFVANYIGLKGDDRLFRMDRFDMRVKSTLYGDLNSRIHDDFISLLRPEVAKDKKMMGSYLLNEGNVSKVVRGLTAVTKTPDGRWVTRISTDTYPGALDLNKGGKTSFGSIEKWQEGAIRLVLTQRLHNQLVGKTPEQLQAIPVHKEDNLTRWGIQYMLDPTKDHSLDAMLYAVRSDMKYSGTPRTYFTGGGMWTPKNFKNIGNGKNDYNMNTGLAGSINAVWARIAYDDEQFLIWNQLRTPLDIMNAKSADSTVLEARTKMLNQFTHAEAKTFMERADKLMSGMSDNEMMKWLAERTSGSPAALGVLFYNVKPDAPYSEMKSFMQSNFRAGGKFASFPDDRKLKEIYEYSAPRRMVDVATILKTNGATTAQMQDTSHAMTDQLAGLLNEAPMPSQPDVRWYSRTEQLAALYGLRHPGSELKDMRDFIRKHTADKKALANIDFKPLFKRYGAGKYDASARFYRFNLNDRIALAFPKGSKRPQSAYGMLLVKQRLLNPDVSIDDAVAESYADHIEMDKWRRSPRQARAQNRAITMAMQKAASIEVEQIKRSWGYPYHHKAHSLARVLGAEGNSAEGVANFVSTMLNGGQRISLSRFDKLEFAPDPADPNNPHPTSIVTNGRTGPQAVDPMVAKHALLLARNSIEDPTGTFHRLNGVFRYPDVAPYYGAPVEAPCKTGTNGESTDAIAKRANSTYMRGAFGVCSFGPSVVVVSQMLLFGATSKDNFTSGTQVQTFMIEKDVIQELINRTYAPVPGAVVPKVVAGSRPPYAAGKPTPSAKAEDLFKPKDPAFDAFLRRLTEPLPGAEVPIHRPPAAKPQ